VQVSDAVTPQDRREAVKAAMEHAWKGYKVHAWGYDEVRPQSKRGRNNWGGQGVTIVDSLDTLWLMGLTDEFKKAQEWVTTALKPGGSEVKSVFETTIRVLGGLLSAYDLSKEDVFRDQARALGDKLMPAFDTETGIPLQSIDMRTGKGVANKAQKGSSVLSELGTLQLEFRYLSHITDDPKYAIAVNAVFDHLVEMPTKNGLYPLYMSPVTGQFTTRKISFGALGDSFYEYLLKVWLQGGKSESAYRAAYDRAMDGMHDVLLQKTLPSGLSYVAEWTGSQTKPKMDHLACFLPGMLALGAVTSEDPARAERDMSTAKELMTTCREMYTRMPTGLAPEYVHFQNGDDFSAKKRGSHYLLRPETVESLFVLYQLTKDEIYREWSWEIFQAIERHCKTEVAYGAFPDVLDTSRAPDNSMESFFLGETLKYLYLIQDDSNSIDLFEVVLNTEAHPIKVYFY
ncbi:unnamed protein product, partial [Chrysoparadoxa australica]